MPSAVVVRSMWGDEKTMTLAKVIQDLQIAEQWRRNLRLVEQRVIAYGSRAEKAFRQFGYDPICVPEKTPQDWAHVKGHSHIHGLIHNGLSFWWHKLDAIRIAWDIHPRPDVVLWLDIDTKINRTVNEKLFRVLNRGPVFQGRQRWYKRIQCPWRKWDRHLVYHGGCLFFKCRKFLDRVIELHAKKLAWATDEQAITMAVDERVRRSDPGNHRKAGYDNPCLHGTHNSGWPSHETPVFYEGRRMSRENRIRMWKALEGT